MRFHRTLPALLLTAAMLAAAPGGAAHAGENTPDAESIGAMMKLLKLDEILNREPQPLQHSKVGEETTAPPASPQAPQVAAPAPPEVAKPAPAQQAKAAPQPQTAPARSMPAPVNPAATGAPTGGKGRVNVARPGKLAENSPSGGSQSGGVKSAMPSFGDVVNEPKPKSKIKQVSPAKPIPRKAAHPNARQDGDLDGDGVIEGDAENPAGN